MDDSYTKENVNIIKKHYEEVMKERETEQRRQQVIDNAMGKIDVEALHADVLKKIDDQKDNDYYCVAFDKPVEVKEKSLDNEKLVNMAKKVAKIIVGIGAVTFVIIEIVDFIQHPELYHTTHPDFKGGPGLFGAFERAPENFAPIFENIAGYLREIAANTKGKGM